MLVVFGGTGFLGRQIVRHLVEAGRALRVAVRHPERASFPTEGDAVEPVRADVQDEAGVAAALAGANGVVNAVGHYVEHGPASFEAVHGEGARHVARAAAAAGVRRLVHISGIGADPNSSSSYVRARALGERLVRETLPEATILRPSVLFGPGDAFFEQLAAIARLTPVLPLFGSGEVKLQPVYVGDVAEAVARALALDAARGRTYELGGPRTYSYRALLRLLLGQLGRRRLLLPFPYVAWDLLATLSQGRPVSRDQVALMRQDNTVAPGALSFADLGIAPHAVEEILPGYLGIEPDAPAG